MEFKKRSIFWWNRLWTWDFGYFCEIDHEIWWWSIVAGVKQAIESFNELHDLKIYPLSKEVGDRIVNFLIESSEFIGLSKGNEIWLSHGTSFDYNKINKK